ncbi:sigma-70 family RNA polymerase sigma factor [Salinactinospora qingdaonensis]|uniref:RNA polymerase sigma factor n=1 Tax=Salinactinospora qingdaonensis TaxID=702744 RepID=A0ABP7F348_9ACTN
MPDTPGNEDVPPPQRAPAHEHIDVRPSTEDEYFRFREVFDAHHEAVLKFVLRINGGRRPQAEDITQETLLKAWRSLDGLHGDVAQIRPWLYTVARRLVIDAERTRQARPREVSGAPSKSWPRATPRTR